MAEPKVRFKRDDGNGYPAWVSTRLLDLFQRINERNNGQFDNTKWISVAKMYYQNPDKVQSNNIDTRTYVMRYGDIAFEGHPNDEFMYGRFVLNDIGDGVISELFPIYRFRKEYVLKYWKHAIQVEKVMAPVYRKAITSSGASSNKLNEDDFLRESIYVPCLEEQQKIADFLSSVDDVVTASEEELANLEKQKKAVMKKIFSQEVRFRKGAGTEFPKWEEKKLGDVGTVLMCKRVFKEQTDTEGDIPFFKIGTFGGMPDAYISQELFDELKEKYSFPKKGNILLSAAGTIGRAVVYNGEDAYYQDSNIVWLDHDDTLSDEYLFQFYSMTSWDNLEGGTVKRLYNGILLDKDIGIPCLEEQHLIADFLSDFDEAIAAAKKELELWKELKKGLLQQMFV